MTLCSIVSRPLQALLLVCICLTICVEAHRETPLVLSNGVTAYVRTSEGPKAHACLHVVAKGRSPAESKVWSLEPSHGGLATVESFFASCAEEIRRSRLRQEVGVIAVGSFDRASMEEMIAHHFSSLPRVVHDATPLQVRYLPNRLSSMVAVEFRDPATEGGLEEMWRQALCLQVLQSYAECAVRDVGGVWIHAPFAHFFPSNCMVVETYLEPEGPSLVLLALLLYEVEVIKRTGIDEQELQEVRSDALLRLHYLAAREPEQRSRTAAALLVGQFLHSQPLINYDALLERSFQIVEQITAEDLTETASRLFQDEHRRLSLLFPSLGGICPLAEEAIEEVIDFVETLADSEESEEGMIQLLMAQVPKQPWPATFRDQVRSERPRILLAALQEDEDEEEEEDEEEIPVDEARSDPFAKLPAHDPYAQLPLTAQDKMVISQVIMNMADKSVVELAFDKKEMEKKGRRINHVHPMKFIGYIMAQPRLKRGLREIQKSVFKWDAFIDGFSGRMREEATHNNLLSYVDGMALVLEVEAATIKTYIERGDYEGLVKRLLQ